MSEQTNYCTTKGLGWAFLIVSAFILLVPMGMTYASVGHDDYARYCRMTPVLLCFGVGE
jgi:hypothetical protein|tara:strand:+ start:423 stop:599 length:177 start_codon:yes stop_codon:yes gene_type:complete